jgi:NTP pyrophosphatase (non-canonical NTP hydrolase)
MYPKRGTTIRQAQERVKDFLESREKNWTQIDNHFYLFTHMMEEAGELASHIVTLELNLSPDRVNIEKDRNDRKHLPLIKDDLGDLLYCIIKLAVAYNIDLNEAFEKAMSSIEQRYSKKFGRNKV